MATTMNDASTMRITPAFTITGRGFHYGSFRLCTQLLALLATILFGCSKSTVKSEYTNPYIVVFDQDGIEILYFCDEVEMHGGSDRTRKVVRRQAFLVKYSDKESVTTILENDELFGSILINSISSLTESDGADVNRKFVVNERYIFEIVEESGAFVIRRSEDEYMTDGPDDNVSFLDAQGRIIADYIDLNDRIARLSLVDMDGTKTEYRIVEGMLLFSYIDKDSGRAWIVVHDKERRLFYFARDHGIWSSPVKAGWMDDREYGSIFSVKCGIVNESLVIAGRHLTGDSLWLYVVGQETPFPVSIPVRCADP